MFPEVYEFLLENVKPQRQVTFDKSGTRDAEEYFKRWWLFGKPRQDLRPALAGLDRYIVTVETAKHRVFQFLDASILPDNMLVAIAIDDGFHLGVMSSRAHIVWALAAGGTLEDRPRYSKSRCFDPFPFPDATATLKRQIGALADELDALRKQVLADHDDLTLTALYNVLEDIKAGTTVGQKSQDIRERGRVFILKDLHEQIDALVAEAYGWPADLGDDGILTNLVALNADRVAKERTGLIRWLRPDYQIERLGALAHAADRVQTVTAASRGRLQRRFPIEERAQAGEVLDVLVRSRQPVTASQIAVRYKEGSNAIADIEDVLRSLARLGQVETFDNGRSFFRGTS